MISTSTRSAPSWLWHVTEEKRQEMLSKRDSAGQAVWNLERLDDDQALGHPEASADLTETAHALLMAELRERPITEGCDMCGRTLSAARTKQVCQECYGRSERSVKS